MMKALIVSWEARLTSASRCDPSQAKTNDNDSLLQAAKSNQSQTNSNTSIIRWNQAAIHLENCYQNTSSKNRVIIGSPGSLSALET